MSDQNAPDPHAVLSVLARLADAWNAGDADAYGSLFTPDCTYVTFDGQLLDGRTAITDVHRWLFDGPLKGSTMGDPSTGSATPSVRFLRPDVAHVVTTGAVARGEVTPDRDSVPSFVLVRGDDGDWSVAAFHNTRRVTR
jgi:uncharacterized protein (TIGR02246 family)